MGKVANTRRRGRWLMVALFMALSVAALALSNTQGSNAAPGIDCAECEQQCWNDANTGANNTAYWRCIDDGYSQAYCDNQIIKYYNNCISIFCNYGGSCNVAPKPYRFCKIGPC